MTEDEAIALKAAIEDLIAGFNGEDDFELEGIWAEQSEDDWLLSIHFTQGAYRFKHMQRDARDSDGLPADARKAAFDVVTYVLREPHGDGSYLAEPFPRTPDGRYIREGWV